MSTIELHPSPTLLLLLLLLSDLLICLNLCVHICICQEGQKGALDPLELELVTELTRVLGIELNPLQDVNRRLCS